MLTTIRIGKLPITAVARVFVQHHPPAIIGRHLYQYIRYQEFDPAARIVSYNAPAFSNPLTCKKEFRRFQHWINAHGTIL